MFFLIQSWFYKPIEDKALVFQLGAMPAITWSISTEWFFYFCYPFICFLLRKLKSNIKIITFVYSLAIIAFIVLLSFYQNKLSHLMVSIYGPVADIHSKDGFVRWLIYHSPYLRLTEFLLGAFVAEIYFNCSATQPTTKEQGCGFIITIFSIISILICHYYFTHPYWDTIGLASHLQECFGYAPEFAILIFCCARYKNIITEFLSTRFILLGGEISYSIYLLHIIVIGFVFNVFKKLPNYSNITLILLLVSVYLLSILSFKFIEVPARQYIRKRFTIHKQNFISVSNIE